MSYLIENSDVITKKTFEEDEDRYIPYQKYTLGEYLILTENKKPFFSIYDIANFCKKRYKKDKLFLIVHRYFDEVTNEKITEFYIFNTVNIFDKALTSFLYVEGVDLIGKQNVLIRNINIAKKLLDTSNLHVILGDNVKEHEIVEYLNLEENTQEIEIFDKLELNPKEKFKKFVKKYETPKSIRVSRISRILKTIRILEPQEAKLKRYLTLIVSTVLLVYFIDDYIVTTNDDYKRDLKREVRDLNRDLTKVSKDLQFQKKKFKEQTQMLERLKLQKVYKPE
jgi:hypothetical protein